MPFTARASCLFRNCGVVPALTNVANVSQIAHQPESIPAEPEIVESEAATRRVGFRREIEGDREPARAASTVEIVIERRISDGFEPAHRQRAGCCPNVMVSNY